MAVITISRQIGSLGDSVAQILEERDGLPRSDQRALEELISRSGIPAEMIQEFDERKPSFWRSLSIDRSRYLHFLRSAIISVVSEGSAVLVGRGASVILRDVPGVLHLRLVAPEEVRLRRIMAELGCDRQHADRIMHHSDQDRTGFYRYFFELDWNSPEVYDVTINTADLTPPMIADLARQLMESPAIRCEPEQYRQKIRDMELEQTVTARVLYEEGVPVRFFAARANNGEVTIRGIVSTPGEEQRCADVAGATEGVTKVNTEMSFVPDYVGPTW